MEEIKVQIYNTSNNKLPDYSTKLSAGFDIRADLSSINSYDDLLGNGCYKFSIDEDGNKQIELFTQGGRVLVKSGLFVAIPDGYELQIRPRSGLALNHGITMANSPGTIDSDYRGDIGLIVLNTDSVSSFIIKDGERLAQGVLNEVKQCSWETVQDVEDLGKTDRGAGGYGHTGTK